MGNISAQHDPFLEGLKSAIAASSADASHILTTEPQGKTFQIVTAPATFYNRVVSFLFGSNGRLADVIKKDLTNKYGEKIANFAFNTKDYQHVAKHGLNVLEGMQIYETAKANFEKDQAPPKVPSAQNKTSLAAAKPVAYYKPIVNEAPLPTIFHNPYSSSEADAQEDSSYQDRNSDLTDEHLKYIIAEKRLRSVTSEPVEIENEELTNLSDKELQKLIDVSFHNLTQEECKTVTEYLRKKSENHVNRKWIAYQIQKGTLSAATEETSHLDEELPKLTPKLKHLAEAYELMIRKSLITQFEQEKQDAWQRYKDSITKRINK